MAIGFTGKRILTVAAWLAEDRPHKDIVVNLGSRSNPDKHPAITGIIQKDGIQFFPAKEAGQYVPAVFDEDLPTNEIKIARPS